jgi:hypothetical protein
MSPQIQCPKCGAGLLDGVFNQPGLAPCRSCGTPLKVEVFPALFRKSTPGQSGQAVLVEGESGCFYHPQKRAVRPCDGCGRFLCALCDCNLNEQHFCPACLETGRSKGKIKSLENQRTRYDSIALALAIFPILIVYLTLITAPMTLFIAIRYWNKPASMVRRTRFRLVLAIGIALLQIAGWIAVFTFAGTHKRF